MEAVPMQAVLDAAKAQDRVIGHDGAASPLDVADVMPDQCICDGSGYGEIVFAGVVIGHPVCRACQGG